MLPPDRLVKGGVLLLPCVGDGRQSGTSASPSILNASPEAAIGGGLALLKTGDKVRVDIGRRTANIMISAAELAKRAAAVMMFAVRISERCRTGEQRAAPILANVKIAKRRRRSLSGGNLGCARTGVRSCNATGPPERSPAVASKIKLNRDARRHERSVSKRIAELLPLTVVVLLRRAHASLSARHLSPRWAIP